MSAEAPPWVMCSACSELTSNAEAARLSAVSHRRLLAKFDASLLVFLLVTQITKNTRDKDKDEQSGPKNCGIPGIAR